ncbi:MAG: DEAD/DEAH box helicase family protein, partial [Patescibacteria group bacterium]
MLYQTFNSIKESFGQDYFISRLDDQIVQNLNSKFELREYQKEALGRFDFYFSEYQKRAHPAQLLFHMATGSGKTLIMAANILQLYQKGYRNFIFFVNSTNIIEKTRDNFLNEISSKYLFSEKIKFGEKEVKIKEVDNFEAANQDNINIVFTTIQGLHTRLNYPKENALTYEDFENKEIVLISDEAHHINTLTKSKLNKTEQEEVHSWEGTVERIFQASPKNILLEFTATIDLSNPAINEKYQDKIIFQYDLKQFRLDGYSKEIEVLEADMEPVDRALQAIIISQYRRKIAEKNGIPLKPVVMFKANYVNPPSKPNPNAVVSAQFKEEFLKKIKNLQPRDLAKFKNSRSKVLQKAFEYFANNKISLENLILEIQNDFDETKCLSVDSNEDKEKNQVLVNTLEAEDNEIRAVFAVEMLNEGWDVLNLFDIVRLYDTRDANKNRPGKTTMAEAQLIGRGARYYPFVTGNEQDQFKRKFDQETNNELRILEQLYYHSAHNPRYIQELKTALTDIGIMPEKYIQKEIFVKNSFKKTDFWKKGVIFLNERVKNPKENIFSLDDANIAKEHSFQLKTGEATEETLLGQAVDFNDQNFSTEPSRKVYFLADFDENIVRAALDRIEFYQFANLKGYFPNLKSVSEFITSSKYLAGVRIEVTGAKKAIKNLSSLEKLAISLFVLKKIAQEAKANTAEYIGTRLFRVKQIKDVFADSKVIKLANDDERVRDIREINLAAKSWFAQNDFYGTSEEESFIDFFEKSLDFMRKKYDKVALLRNERHFKIFDFEEGRAFEPDFLLILKKKSSQKNTVLQVFIEPKGDQFKDADGGFEQSKEGWKQKLLLGLEKESKLDLKLENENFKLLVLPFYNESLK